MRLLVSLCAIFVLIIPVCAQRQAHQPTKIHPVEASWVEDPAKRGCYELRIRLTPDGRSDPMWITVIKDIGEGCYERRPIYHDRNGQPLKERDRK
jgi:hypothetical protein